MKTQFHGRSNICPSSSSGSTASEKKPTGRLRLLNLAPLFLGALLSGCASITGTTKQALTVQTFEKDGKEVRNANCVLINDKGKWVTKSPSAVTVTPSNEDMRVACTKKSGAQGNATVVSVTRGAMFANIILGGGIGALVDYNSGAAFEYPSPIQVTMGASKKIDMMTTAFVRTRPAPPRKANAADLPMLHDDDWYRIYVIPNPRYSRE